LSRDAIKKSAVNALLSQNKLAEFGAGKNDRTEEASASSDGRKAMKQIFTGSERSEITSLQEPPTRDRR